MAEGFDLGSVLAEVNNRMAAVKQEAQGINAAYGAQIGAVNSQSRALADAGEATKVIQSQASQGALQVQANNQRAATAFGTNMNDPSEIVTALGDTFRKSVLELQQEQAKVTQIESQAHLGNPLGLIYDAFWGDGARAKLEGAKANADNSSKALNAAFNLTQEAARANAATAETLSIAGEQARLDLITAETAIKQGEVSARAAGINVSRLSAMQNQNEQQLNLMIKGMQLQDAAEQRAFMNEQRTAVREERAAAKADDNVGLNLYNLGRKARGQPEVDMPFYKTQQRIGKPDLLETMQLGERYYGKDQADWGKVPVGANAVESLIGVMDMGLPMAPGEEVMAEKLTSSFADAQNPQKIMSELGLDMQSAAAIATDKTKRGQVAQQLIEKRARREITQLRPNDKSSIYQVPSLGILKDTAAMSTNPFLSRVVKPLADNNSDLDGNLLLQQAAGLVAKGELSSADVVAGMQYVANQLAGNMHETNNYSRYRLPSPVTSGFNIAMSNGTGILRGSQSRVVNLMDPTQVNEALARSLGSLNLLSNAANNASKRGLFEAINRGLERGSNIDSWMNDPALRRPVTQ